MSQATTESTRHSRWHSRDNTRFAIAHDDACSLASLLSCSQREGGGCFDRVLLLQSSNILYAIMALLKDLDRESLQIVRAELDNLLD